ncbi:DNA-directed RNA polymerase subunit alpha [Medicago truncatula]|uniref:DNA-directed RNA polymerase subunit alpha n=1 Tax=Medicago truncatula TaxID=3880 RepID=G7JPG5_MEDTR|nr:DNA-directed RNA polymerase subunit alpha [Medicago truncatula]
MSIRTQFNLTEPINFCIELQIERNYTIDAVSMPVRNANHSIHSYVNGNEKQEIHSHIQY